MGKKVKGKIYWGIFVDDELQMSTCGIRRDLIDLFTNHVCATWEDLVSQGYTCRRFEMLHKKV